jgi:hypothetical protein
MPKRRIRLGARTAVGQVSFDTDRSSQTVASGPEAC